jgi:hypothetical protein
MTTLAEIWREVEVYRGDGAKCLELQACCVEFYLGAMAIPLVVFRPQVPGPIADDRIGEFAALLRGYGLEIECVEEGRNYKINRRDTHAYVGRLTEDALKLHVTRIVELGFDVFKGIAGFYLRDVCRSMASYS